MLHRGHQRHHRRRNDHPGVPLVAEPHLADARRDHQGGLDRRHAGHQLELSEDGEGRPAGGASRPAGQVGAPHPGGLAEHLAPSVGPRERQPRGSPGDHRGPPDDPGRPGQVLLRGRRHLRAPPGHSRCADRARPKPHHGLLRRPGLAFALLRGRAAAGKLLHQAPIGEREWGGVRRPRSPSALPRPGSHIAPGHHFGVRHFVEGHRAAGFHRVEGMVRAELAELYARCRSLAQDECC
mmetsp:Transcript_112618/g.319345  ORF Transcript_112618/g.319345 Transcript_112618/m.319345 type:complete len:238 (-) Transcript_112618:1180-1893(-)